MKHVSIIILSLALLLLGAACDKSTKTNTNKSAVVTNTRVVLPTSTLLVQAESGELLNQGTNSFIGAAARGGEAYLAEGGAAAKYTVKVTFAGKYTLSVRLQDDGTGDNGTRNATITSGDQTLTYVHTAENTNGWKWYSLGDLDLIKGDNVVLFTKDKTTSAAYIMDAFKLIPVR